MDEAHARTRLSQRQQEALRIIRKLDRDGFGAAAENVRSHLIQAIAAEPNAPQRPSMQADRCLNRLVARGTITLREGRYFLDDE